MAKSMITVLCPSGHRRKAQMTSNRNLLQVLEDMCLQESLDSSDWGLTIQRKKCDLSIPWRLLAIPTNALLEMYKLDEPRAASDVTVQLQLPDNSRYPGSFNPSVTLQQMLDWYRQQPECTIAALDSPTDTDNHSSYPVCAYMSEEVIDSYALSHTTLRELGLTSGAAVVRYTHRSLSEEDLKKINNRIDEKIARRQQQQQQAAKSVPVATAVDPTPLPPAPQPVTTSNPSFPITTTNAPSFNDDQYSIFRNVPVSHPPRTTSQQEPRTLAEALGIKVSFDHHPLQQQQQQQLPQTDFSNFKFPEATKGQDLHQDTPSDHSQNSGGSKSCDRHAMAYDLTAVPSRSETTTEELPDSFFEVTPDDLRSVLQTLRQQGAEENPLETRSMRERAQSARTAAYEHIAIRLVVNSNHILQGLFYPEESVSTLMDFARTNLRCPQLEQPGSYLYTSPPRVVFSDLKKSLSAYDCVPAAYVYLGHRTVSPLVIQLAPNIPIGTIEEANQIVTQHVFNATRSTNITEMDTTGYNDRSPAETNAASRPTKRNPPANNVDDSHLRDKLRKFLPGKK